MATTTLFIIIAGSTRAQTPTDYQESWKYAHRMAVKYRHQRDHLQQLLTRRVLEVRELRHRVVSAQRAVRHRPDVVEAIRLAATAYRVSFAKLYRRALCETGGSLNPYSKNRYSSASGVFQFLRSTWASTPYANESIWSPYSNAMAAAWMESVGRGGEWVCR